jgi:hypothetical protein
MESSTASTIGTILGAFAASFLAQTWGNFVTRKARDRVIKSTAAQSTSNDILTNVIQANQKVDVLVSQPGVVNTLDHRSPKGESNDGKPKP